MQEVISGVLNATRMNLGAKNVIYWLFLTPVWIQHIQDKSCNLALADHCWLITQKRCFCRCGSATVHFDKTVTRRWHAAGDVNSAVASCVRAQQTPPDTKWHHNSNDNDDCSDHTAVFACFNTFTADCLYFTLLANIFQPSRLQLVECIRWSLCVFYVWPAETWNTPERRASSQ